MNQPTSARDTGPDDAPDAPRIKEMWVDEKDGCFREAPDAQGQPMPQPCPPGSTANWYEVDTFEDFIRAARLLDVDLRHNLLRAGFPAGKPNGRPFANIAHLGPDWLLIITPTAAYSEEDQVTTGLFACLIGPDCAVSVEQGNAQVHERIRERITEGGRDKNPAAQRVAVAALVSLVSVASDVDLALGDAVADMETLVFGTATRSDPVVPIYQLKREITEARRTLMPLSAELPDLVDRSVATNIAFDQRTLVRLQSAVERIDRHLDAHDSLLSDMLAAHLSRVSVRQNEDMRKISSWAAILVFPTIIAGIYGMNFDHLPELHWHVGYPLAVVLMAAGCFVLYRTFKRVGWL